MKTINKFRNNSEYTIDVSRARDMVAIADALSGWDVIAFGVDKENTEDLTLTARVARIDPANNFGLYDIKVDVVGNKPELLSYQHISGEELIMEPGDFGLGVSRIYS